MILLLILGWLACFVFSWSVMCAAFEHESDSPVPAIIGLLSVIIAPIMFVVSFIFLLHDRHGFGWCWPDLPKWDNNCPKCRAKRLSK
jgi:hypothetical protein